MTLPTPASPVEQVAIGDRYAIEVTGLRKSYGDVPVLDGIDLMVERGTMLGLLGPNGAGKPTTELRHFCPAS